MKVIDIPVAEIMVGKRMRPVTEHVIEAIFPGIKRDGVRQPIEVARTAKGCKLVSGLHRLEASRRAGRGTIPAVIVKGSAAELRRMELSENLTRNDLSALERCQFTAEMKRLFLEENPDARRGVSGGKARHGQQVQSPALADWYAEIATRSERGVRTIKLQASIGERLDDLAADKLRGTDIEDNQFELEALSKLAADDQRKIAGLLADPDTPAWSVREALAVVLGKAVDRQDGEDRAVRRIVERWRRWPRARRREFVYALSDEEFDEMVDLRRARAGEEAA